jgi:nucleotide-binding universal stress UspA family protein
MATKIKRKEFDYLPSEASFREKQPTGKKFLAVFDGFKFSESTLEYGIQLTREANADLIGVFLDEFIYRSYSPSLMLNRYNDAEKVLDQLDAKDKAKRDESVQKFVSACSKASIRYAVHRNTNIAIHEVLQESIFADLIIINENETFNRFSEKAPTRFIKELLTSVQCPVLVLPEKSRPIDKILLLYDGGPSSVFAVKMFSYIFGSLKSLPVEVLTVKDKMEGSHLPSNKLMREFLKRHFPSAEYVIKKGNAEEEVLGHLRFHKGNELVVLGAYRRSEISRWFKTSMADILIRELSTPLFIAHNK